MHTNSDYRNQMISVQTDRRLQGIDIAISEDPKFERGFCIGRGGCGRPGVPHDVCSWRLIQLCHMTQLAHMSPSLSFPLHPNPQTELEQTGCRRVQSAKWRRPLECLAMTLRSPCRTFQSRAPGLPHRACGVSRRRLADPIKDFEANIGAAGRPVIENVVGNYREHFEQPRTLKNRGGRQWSICCPIAPEIPRRPARAPVRCVRARC